MGKATWDLTDEEAAKLVTEVENLNMLNNSPTKLPNVVPIVSLKNPACYNFGLLPIDALIVMF